MPPLWQLRLKNVPKCAAEVVLPPEYLALIDNQDQVETLRSKKQSLSSGELTQPILEQIEDELHSYYSDYCST